MRIELPKFFKRKQEVKGISIKPSSNKELRELTEKVEPLVDELRSSVESGRRKDVEEVKKRIRRLHGL